VINRVHVLARRTAANVALLFSDSYGTPIPDLDDDDDVDDDDYFPPDDESINDADNYAWPGDDDDDDADHDSASTDHADPAAINFAAPNDVDDIAGVNDNNDDPNDPNEIAGVVHNPDTVPNDNDIDSNDEHTDSDNSDYQNSTDDSESNTEDNNDSEDDTKSNYTEVTGQEANALTKEDNVEDTMNERYGERSGTYNLRARKPRDYGHLHATLEHIVMTQHSIKRGLKEFGDAGVDAVLKELLQLHERKVLEPRGETEMSDEEKKAALQYLMFLKKKRNGTIKGRGCADGRKQRQHITKEEASSPTVAIEAVMLSCVIDAMEKRDVATVDIPGAFMQADMDDTVHMKLEGKMAELLVRIDPMLYRKHVQLERGKQVLYVELKKALYGTLKAALLFWKRLSTQLVEWGFISNPYDPCVVNKIINGSQCTILWHVDDLKISHVDPEVVTEVIDLLEREFGKEAPLTKTRGHVHEYLGMTIDFSVTGKVKFSMIDYIKEMLDGLPEDMTGESVTPAADHLFTVNADAEKLNTAEAEIYHHNTAKLLFLCKRARPDIQTAVAFLCTRVQHPDVDDYKKLGRVMRYLRATMDMPLTLEANSANLIKWWGDASYAVHPDMRSHTGGGMTLGRGIIYATSTRQKLNTKSSTEAELVGVNDIMPQVLWTRYFLEAQGFDISDSIVFQDNQSAILLEKNGRASSSKRTRHINIRYFFVKDRIDAGEVRIEYCPTQHMLADFFTKPLQGTQFRLFRDQIMNINPHDGPHEDYRSVLEIAESKPRTDDGWTMVQTKNKQVRFKAKVETVNVSGKSKNKDETLQVSGILKPGLPLETREQNSSCAHI